MRIVADFIPQTLGSKTTNFMIRGRGGNKNVKMNKRSIRQNNNFTRASYFLEISLTFLLDNDVKLLNFTFCGGRKVATTKFYFSFCTNYTWIGILVQRDSPTFDKSKWVGIIAIEIGRT